MTAETVGSRPARATETSSPAARFERGLRPGDELRGDELVLGALGQGAKAVDPSSWRLNVDAEPAQPVEAVEVRARPGAEGDLPAHDPERPHIVRGVGMVEKRLDACAA